MVRPKSKEKKERLNLSVSGIAVIEGRAVAEHLGKSLSELTEEQYRQLHHNIIGVKEEPKKILEEMKIRLQNIEEAIKKQEKEEEKEA